MAKKQQRKFSKRQRGGYVTQSHHPNEVPPHHPNEVPSHPAIESHQSDTEKSLETSTQELVNEQIAAPVEPKKSFLDRLAFWRGGKSKKRSHRKKRRTSKSKK